MKEKPVLFERINKMNRAERLIKLKKIHKELLRKKALYELEEKEEKFNEESSLSFSNFGVWTENGLIYNK